MGKKKIVELSDEQRVELEKGYRKGKSHAFRQCCRMILLKSEKFAWLADKFCVSWQLNLSKD